MVIIRAKRILTTKQYDDFYKAFDAQKANNLILLPSIFDAIVTGDDVRIALKGTDPTEFKQKMRYERKRLDEDGDFEETHIRMDAIMCELLKNLGYGEGVDIFMKTAKRYV